MMLAYAITDPHLYGREADRLREALYKVLSASSPDLVVLRDKSASLSLYRREADTFLEVARDFSATRFLLHGTIPTARQLGADGVHLPGGMIEAIPEAKAAGLWTVVSTHSEAEALRAQLLGADAVTFSPVFETPGKGPARGLEKLKEIKDRITIKLFALGGIVTGEQIRAVERAGADGFASIRYFARLGGL